VLDGRTPVHITLKLVPGLPSLRRREVFTLLQDAFRKARHRGLAVVHYAVISNHIHLLCEPEREGLRAEMQSLCISLSKRLNAYLERSGAIFVDRYHLHVLRTPTEVHHVLGYILSNQARHALGCLPLRGAVTVRVDTRSSAFAFRHWRELFGARVRFEFSGEPEDRIEAWHREILVAPRTWLLRQGWRRATKRVRH
jgi:REP element-mobilizing transposase RayT